MKRWGIIWLAIALAFASTCVCASEKVTLYLTNAQGTVVATMDTKGNVTYTAAYRPYGKQQVGTPQSGPGYTGHVNDPGTGLVYMQARYYDPEIGRFLSPDPVAPTSGNLFNFGRYTYVNDNPVDNTDPDGRQSCPQCLYYPESMAGSYEHQAEINQGASRIALEGMVGLAPVVGDAQSVVEATNNPTPLNIAIAVVGIIPEAGTAITDVAKVAKVAKEAEKGSAEVERAKNIAKGIPESRLGPSGKPMVHTVEHSTRKAAREAAEREAPAGGKARFDAHPQDGQKPHFQAEDANGVNAKPVVHHCVPNKSC